MAQQLRVLALSPGLTRLFITISNSNSKGCDTLFWYPCTASMHAVCIHRRRQHIIKTVKIKNKQGRVLE